MEGNRPDLLLVVDRMRGLFLRARILDLLSASWLPVVVALALAACQQKGSGPGY
jgi:hypothetical protein